MNAPQPEITPEITDVSRPYWDALAEGRLIYQECRQCGAAWLPPRPQCPQCLEAAPYWRPAAGMGRVVSWVVYHHAYAAHLEPRIPYDVTIVQLDEGPRLLTNVVDSAAGRRLSVGARVRLCIETESGTAVARFRLAE